MTRERLNRLLAGAAQLPRAFRDAFVELAASSPLPEPSTDEARAIARATARADEYPDDGVSDDIMEYVAWGVCLGIRHANLHVFPVHAPQIEDNAVVLGIALDAAGDLDIARIKINAWIAENWPKSAAVIPDLSSADIANIDVAAAQEGSGSVEERMTLAYNLAVSRIPGASTPSMLAFAKENKLDLP